MRFSVFALLAPVLVAVGIYGLLAYYVAQQTREIRVRMALGAQSGEVLRMVLARGLKLTIGGIGIDLIAELGLGRLIGSLLYGVKASDPLTDAGVTLLLVIVALLACWLPVRVVQLALIP